MASADPIVAVATPEGRGGIGVVRVSGADLQPLIEGMLDRTPAPRVACYTRFRGSAGEVLDQGLALLFPAPASYTGETVLELHGHGGRLLLDQLVRRCLELGARLAEPGEFTRRAFLNGKLDLAQAEAVADLIDAQSTRAARAALQSLTGEFSRRVESAGAAILQLRALVEACLDFPEEDEDFLPVATLADGLLRLGGALDELLRDAGNGAALGKGLVVALVGRPNVGKSSLLNRLAGEDLAIVADHPGTTRDSIRQSVVVGGVNVQLVDTAGLRDTEDPVELLGIERTRAALGKADLALLVTEAGYAGPEPGVPEGLPRIRVVNKIDLSGEAPAWDREAAVIRVSAKHGLGIDLLRAALLERAGLDEGVEVPFLARQRHLDALRRARDCLAAAEAAGRALELVAEELRRAHHELGRIIGAVSADELLGEIFGRFCIGK